EVRRARRAAAVVGARALPAQHLPAGHAAGDGSGAPIPVRLEPVAESPDLAPLRERQRAAARAREGAGRAGRYVALRARRDLADVIANNLDLLFPGMQIEQCSLFRVTRNAITERDEEEAEDLLEMIEIELRERKFSPVVRLQVEKGMNPTLRGRLAAELELD